MSDAYTCTNTGHGGFVCRTCHGKTIQSLEQKVSALEREKGELVEIVRWCSEDGLVAIGISEKAKKALSKIEGKEGGK